MSWGRMMAVDQLGWGMVEEVGWRKGPWTAEEDRLLIEYVKLHGEGRWNSVSRLAGLMRNGKSCRLRWVNYLRPDLKRGQITPHEEKIILELHARWGNRWSTIARSLPGRTDNEIKNYWRTHFKKKAKGSSDLNRLSSDKSKARLLRRQQFHQLQLQQQQQKQQQQQLLQPQQQQTDDVQLHHQHHQTFDMKKFMSLLDQHHQEADENNIKKDGGVYVPTNSVPYHQYYNSSADNHQVFLCSMFNNYAFAPEGMNDQDSIWDGLWNLDDVNGSINCPITAIYHAPAQAETTAPVVPFYY